jgi:hypothetical protein
MCNPMKRHHLLWRITLYPIVEFTSDGPSFVADSGYSDVFLCKLGAALKGLIRKLVGDQPSSQG